MKEVDKSLKARAGSSFQGFQAMVGCFSVAGPWTSQKLMVEGHREAVGMTTRGKSKPRNKNTKQQQETLFPPCNPFLPSVCDSSKERIQCRTRTP